MNNRVVITGVGLATPLGNTAALFTDQLLSAQSHIQLNDYDGEDFAVGRVLDDLDIKDAHRFSKADRATLFALHASRQAFEDAGIAHHGVDRHEFAVFLGAGLAGAIKLEDSYRRMFQQGNKRVRPSTVLNGMANAPSAQLSIEHGIKGPSMNISSACSSSSVAILQGVDHVRKDAGNVAIVGGTEALLAYGHLKAWQATGALTQTRQEEGFFCSPFSQHRNGMVLGEGSVVFVLENLAQVKASGRPFYAEVAGGAITSNATHMVQSDFDGQVRVMKQAMDSAGISPQQVDYINAHATATITGDPIEAKAIASLFSQAPQKCMVSSIKGACGHLLGASGAIGILATILSMKADRLPPNTGCQTVDPEFDIAVVNGVGETRMESEYALSNSFAFGGHNCSLVLRNAKGLA